MTKTKNQLEIQLEIVARKKRRLIKLLWLLIFVRARGNEPTYESMGVSPLATEKILLEYEQLEIPETKKELKIFEDFLDEEIQLTKLEIAEARKFYKKDLTKLKNQ